MSFRRALLAPAHHAADDRSRTNSNVSARESVYVVAEVIPSEGADVAGIKVDDVIVSVQCVAASPLSTLQMMDLISGAENSSVQVQVEGTWVAEAPHDAATVPLDNKTVPDARANGDSLARVTPKRVIWNSQSRAIDGSSSGDCGQGGSAPGQRHEVPSGASSEVRIGQTTDLSPEGAGQPTRPSHAVDGSAGVGKIDTGNTYIVAAWPPHGLLEAVTCLTRRAQMSATGRTLLLVRWMQDGVERQMEPTCWRPVCWGRAKAKAKTKTLCWHMKRQEQLHTGMNCASKSRDLWATSQQFPLRYKCGGSRTILYASEPIVSLHL